MYAWLESFIENLHSLPCRYVVIIAGNHDLVMEPDAPNPAGIFDEIQEHLGLISHYVDENGSKQSQKKIHYLNESSVELMGLKFWGSPITRQVNRCRKFWAFETNSPHYDIPPDTDIILTHQPSDFNGLGDVHWNSPFPSKPLGCKVLTEAVEMTRAKYHFCGHIHTGNHQASTYRNGITMGVNVSMLDEYYEPAYAPYLCTLQPADAS